MTAMNTLKERECFMDAVLYHTSALQLGAVAIKVH